MQIVNVTLTNYPAETIQLEQKVKPNEISIEFIPGSDNDISEVEVQGIEGGPDSLIIRFTDTCVPDNAVYVRWINIHGGYEYSMFTSRITNTLKTSNLETFTPQIQDYSQAVTLQEVLGRRAENLIMLGVYQIPRNEYLRLRGLLTTPKIDVYDQISSQWLGAVVTNQTATYEGTFGIMDFEVEIMLNERVLQSYNQ